MAASRTAPTTANSKRRISFAKIREPLEVPNLLALQIDSFDWLLGNSRWQARVEPPSRRPRRPAVGVRLQEILEEISPIEDFSGTMSLSFSNPRFEEPKNTIDECKERDFTYSAPLFVTAEFINNETGEIKSPDGVHGRLPAHDRQGHVHHQRHRAGRRLPAGPLAGRLLRAHHRQDLGQGRLHRQGHPVPGCVAGVRDRQARHGRRPARPQAQAERHRAAQGARLDPRADPRGVRRLRVDARSPWRRTTPPPRTTRCSTSTASCARASRRPARPRSPCSRTPTSTPSATTWPRSAATRSTRSSGLDQPLGPEHADPRRHRRDDLRYLVRLHAGGDRVQRRARPPCGSRPTTSTTSATGGCARSAS